MSITQLRDIHWLDFPRDNINKILGSNHIELDRLSTEYNTIPKDMVDKLEQRYRLLYKIASSLDHIINNEGDKLGKIKHYIWLRDIAIRKGNYLKRLEEISTIENIPKYLEEYHIKDYQKDISNTDKEYLELNNFTMFSLNKEEYWGNFWLVSLDPCHRQLSSYLIAWQNLNQENSYNNIIDFFLWLETLELPKHIPTERYFRIEEKLRYQITIHNNSLCDNNLEPVSYDNPHEHYLFVMDTYYLLYICRETSDIFHSSFSIGKPILAAGKLYVSNGKVNKISLNSGHYLPTIESGYNFIENLISKGYTSDNEIEIEYFHDRNMYSKKIDINHLKSKTEFKEFLLDQASKCHNSKEDYRANNPFTNPKKFRELTLQQNLLSFKKQDFTGKSLACIFLTRFCGVGCPFCFYKSAPPWRKGMIADEFSEEGVEKFIKFADNANLGYLLVSGGGEPLNCKKHILELVRKVKTDRIVLVTSGHWAKNYKVGNKYVTDIEKAINTNTHPVTVVLRISVSKDHCKTIGYEPVRNLIKIFRERYVDHPNFKLQIKTFENDVSIGNAIENIDGITKLDDTYTNLSDNSIIIKKIPKKYVLKTTEGLEINVGVSKIFYSTLQADLNNDSFVIQSIKVFEEDLVSSEDDNPGVVFNDHGVPGIDWSISYNADTCTWQNQVRDNYKNLYEDTYEEIYSAAINDPITYSLLDKGRRYRERIIEEVNPRALLRMKAIALRDTSGAIIFEEEHTRLYFAIRVLQTYIEEGKIPQSQVKQWHPELKRLVSLEKNKLIELYNNSTYSIIKQQMNKKFNEQEWLDLFYLINLGHYDVNYYQILGGIEYYNKHTGDNLKDISHVHPYKGDIERRLTERIMHIKPLKRFQNTEQVQSEEEICEI